MARPPEPRRRTPPSIPPSGRRRRGRLWRCRRVLLGGAVTAFAVVTAGVAYVTATPLPGRQPLAQTTFVYDSSGHRLAAYTIENRVDVPLSAVPRQVIDAVVSTEDRHYFSEGALNPVSMVRALLSDLGGSGSLQGGSTITQQYVKQAYLTPQRTISRKIKEAAIAIKLQRSESKDQILQNYLNTIYLGRGAYGVEAAARAYFGVDISQVTLPEAALIAGLIRDPETADPAHDPALARRHQADTLAAMVRDHHISPAQATAALAVPLASYVKRPSSTAAALTTTVPGDAYFLAAVHAQLVSMYGASVADGGGLRVTTTLDDTLQREAYDTVYGGGPGSLDPAAGDPSAALVSVDDHGRVRALVGGQNFALSQVDLALGTAGGGSGRQPGSAFKAFMLAEVLKEGYTPASTFPAPPEIIVPHGNADGSPWTVKNFAGEAGSNQTSLVQATAQSINTVYAQVVERIGPAKLDAMAELDGISPKELVGAYPSQVLGSADVSPLEMAAAYATFADHGVYTAPMLITKVTRADGTPVALPKAATHPVLTPAEDAELTAVLRQVVSHGTGGGAGGLGTPVAGKTGTTDNSANAWFVGYTPKLSTAVWMGFPQGAVPMANISIDGRYYQSIQGGDIPASLWHNYMKQALASEPGLAGAFPTVTRFTGKVLTPPPAGTLQFPQGLGTTPGSPASTTSPVTQPSPLRAGSSPSYKGPIPTVGSNTVGSTTATTTVGAPTVGTTAPSFTRPGTKTPGSTTPGSRTPGATAPSSVTPGGTTAPVTPSLTAPYATTPAATTTAGTTAPTTGITTPTTRLAAPIPTGATTVPLRAPAG